jgi:hypothetical protein
MEFLRARWQDLLLLTYAVPDEWLQPYLPAGLALDRWEGRACVSLVAFDFRDTRVLRVAWPGCVSFPEVNLRFYVREGDRRGVVFIREYVPSRWVAWTARTLYGEPYRAVPMRSAVGPSGARRHTLWVGGRAHRVTWRAAGPPAFPPEGGVEDHFKEHEWGFGTLPSGAVTRYRVVHPRWRAYRLAGWRLDLDYGALYGEPWGALNGRELLSAIYAEGSAVTVYGYAITSGPPASAPTPGIYEPGTSAAQRVESVKPHLGSRGLRAEPP